MARKRTKDDVLPIIGWRWRDWRASSARAAMSPLARGVYRELLDAHWAEKDCSLPDDDRMLAALAGVSPAEWSAVKEEVLPWLPLNARGRRQNPVTLATWKEALAFRKGKRSAGKEGAEKRWHRHSTAMREPMANDSPSPPSSPIPSSPSHPSEGFSEGIPSGGSPGRDPGRDGTEAPDAEVRLLAAEPNHERQTPGPDGRSRTLERGRVYLERLLKGVAPSVGGRWIDETRNTNPSPGALLRFVAPTDFAALRAEIGSRLPGLRSPDAYVRSALADRWVQVLSRLSEESRTRTRHPPSPAVRQPSAEPAPAAQEGPGRGYAIPPHVLGCPTRPEPSWRLLRRPRPTGA